MRGSRVLSEWVQLWLFLGWGEKGSKYHYNMGPDARKPGFGGGGGGGVANNTGADQPAHPRSLISAFVVRFIETCYRWNLNFIASLCSWGDWSETRFVGNPENRPDMTENRHWQALSIDTIHYAWLNLQNIYSVNSMRLTSYLLPYTL